MLYIVWGNALFSRSIFSAGLKRMRIGGLILVGEVLGRRRGP